MGKTKINQKAKTKTEFSGRDLQFTPSKKRKENRGRKPKPTIVLPVQEEVSEFFGWTQKGEPALRKEFLDFILEHIQESDESLLWEYILRFLWDSALRKVEACESLEENLVGNKLNVLTAKQHGQHKGKEIKKKVIWRTVALSDKTLDLFRILKLKGIIESGYLLRLSEGLEASKKRIDSELNKLSGYLNLSDVCYTYTKRKHKHLTSKMFRNGRNIFFQKTKRLNLEERAQYLGHETRVQPYYDEAESFSLCDVIIAGDRGIINPKLGNMSFNEFMVRFREETHNINLVQP